MPGSPVQIDDPFLPDIFFDPGFLDQVQMRRRAEIYVEATNSWPASRALRRRRCAFTPVTASMRGPRLYEAALSDIIDYVLKINAGS